MDAANKIVLTKKENSSPIYYSLHVVSYGTSKFKVELVVDCRNDIRAPKSDSTINIESYLTNLIEKELKEIADYNVRLLQKQT
jgi:hypothetical protein